MEQLNNISALENFSSNVPGLMALSHNSFCDHQRPQIPLSFTEPNVPFYDPVLAHFLPTSEGPNSHERNSMKAISQAQNLMNPSPPVCSTGLVGDNTTERNNSCGGKKRKRNSEREVEKPREVVHVRARRGHATDSHSLAERLRREKINEKLRCLQDLVPGCYKTMGMAVMLDVIIKYVQSLQNQIEFLSMKLSAASLFYDFNSSEMEASETIQGTNGYETQVMERMIGEGYGGFPHFQSAWPF